MISPELVVFDLDFTLWDCGGLWIDCTDYPFKRESEGSVRDSSGRHFRLYDDVESILGQLDELGIPLALASRTERPDWASELLALWSLKERFKYQEIYPGSKVSHFQKLNSMTGIPFKSMVFFDDEERNIEEVSRLGVQCHHVKSGVNSGLLDEALNYFSEKYNK